MNPDIVIKQHLQALGIVIVAWFIFADSLILDVMPREIKKYKGSIKRLTTEKQNLENLKVELDVTRSSIQESDENLRELFNRFPKEGNAENDINATVIRITEKIIVQNDQLKPKVTKEFIPEGVNIYNVPQVKSGDPQLNVDNSIMISTYEQQMEIRCNYFELLQFLHDLNTQDLFLMITELSLDPYPDLPYGITAKVKLVTFGFEGFKDRKQNEAYLKVLQEQLESITEDKSNQSEESEQFEEEFY